MSGAGEAVQVALVAALRALAVPVYDAAPVRPPLPHLLILDGVTLDWSVKGARGREVRPGIAVRVAQGEAAALLRLTDSAEAAVEAIARDLPGWRVASVALLRTVPRREAAGPWSARLDYRVRVLEAMG